MPPSISTNAMTVTERLAITPLVVRVLFAQRRFAWVESVTMTMQSENGAPEVMRSISSCAEITFLPPQLC